MSSTLCCVAPPRSRSPTGQPPRRVLHRRSLASLLSRSPRKTPAREPSFSSSLASNDPELRQIFVAASLPEDHPDALHMPGRKQSVDESITRSPSFKTKLRRQLSRRSMASSKKTRSSVGHNFLPPIEISDPLDADVRQSYDADALSLILSIASHGSLRLDDILGPSHEADTGSDDLNSVVHHRLITPTNDGDVTESEHVSRCASSTVEASAAGPDDSKPSPDIEARANEKAIANDKIQTDDGVVAADNTNADEADIGSSTGLLAIIIDDTHVTVDDSNPLPERPKILKAASSAKSLHLHQMRISQHLRSRSQISITTIDAKSTKSQVRGLNGHKSLDTIVMSADDSHRGSLTEPDLFRESRVPSNAASSVYSRDPSTDLVNASRAVALGKAPLSRMSTPSNVATMGSLSVPLEKSGSSASLGVVSKFREDLKSSPHSKTRQKGRSVLGNLIYNAVRLGPRDETSPLLVRAPEETAMYDGVSDQNQPTDQINESVELDDLSKDRRFDGLHRLWNSSKRFSRNFAAETFDRAQSSSSVGDSQSRTSSKHQATSEDARQDKEVSCQGSVDSRNQQVHASRSSRLDSENLLLENALRRHRAEKAIMFRSNKAFSVSGRPGSASASVPSFNSPFDQGTQQRPALATIDDELDPLDTGAPRKSQSMYEVRMTEGQSLKRYRRRKTRGQLLNPLPSWSRFPSHNREQRCGSASARDRVEHHDFAPGEERERLMRELALSQSSSESLKKASTGKRWLVKSSSMTFDSVKRYYMTMFTSSAARGRRSSVAASGRLERPELEMIAPMYSLQRPVAEAAVHAHHKQPLARVMEQVKEEAFLSHHDHHHHHDSSEYTEPDEHPSDVLRDEAVEALQPASGEMNMDGVDERSAAHHPVEMIDVDNSESVVDIGAVEPTTNLDTAGTAISDANRLSRMYQTCVRLPTSLDDSEPTVEAVSSCSWSTEAQPPCAGETEAAPQESDALTAGGEGEGEVTVRRFPSVTVIDDRKGHWRSISMVSAQSGQSVRASTKDLLAAVTKNEDVEKTRLLGA